MSHDEATRMKFCTFQQITDSIKQLHKLRSKVYRLFLMQVNLIIKIKAKKMSYNEATRLKAPNNPWYDQLPNLTLFSPPPPSDLVVPADSPSDKITIDLAESERLP